MRTAFKVKQAQRMHNKKLEPKQLQKTRDWVRENVAMVTETTDRRGFLLLHWPAARSNDANKPVELSLEHEARLKPASGRSLYRLQEKLYKSIGSSASSHLIRSSNAAFGDLVVDRYSRDLGAQSTDRYYDTPGLLLIPRQVTVRERIKTSKFMTWSSGNGQLRPLNLELPFVAYGKKGMTVRLELNWIDELQVSLEEALSPAFDKNVQAGNPFYILMKSQDLQIQNLEPVLEHTTYREKFSFSQVGDDGSTQQKFVINIDHVVAQSVKTHRLATYADVDISSVNVVSKEELAALNKFSALISKAFDLQTNRSTKAHRSAKATGLLR